MPAATTTILRRTRTNRTASALTALRSLADFASHSSEIRVNVAKKRKRPTGGKEMKGNSKLVAASIAIAVGIAFQAIAEAQTNIPRPTYKYEKCFGIVRGGQNDCFKPAHLFAQTSTRAQYPKASSFVLRG